MISEAKYVTDVKMTKDLEGNKVLYIEWDENAELTDRKVKVSFYAKRYNMVRPNLVEGGSIPDGIKNI